MFYPEDPLKEIESIRNAMDILKKDKSVNMIITDYQFISVFLTNMIILQLDFGTIFTDILIQQTNISITGKILI